MSAFVLRSLAMLLMLIDHIGVLCTALPTPLTIACRVLGRFSFPIFAFLIANGYRHTKRPLRYLARLLAVGVLSEPIFDLAFSGKAWAPKSQSVFFTLALGLLGILLFEYCRKKLAYGKLWGCVGLFLSLALAELLHTNYGAYGVALILALHLLADSRPKTAAALVLFGLRGILHFYLRALCGYLPLINRFYPPLASVKLPSWHLITVAAAGACVPILLYNGKKGFSPRLPSAKRLMQASFYLFFALHLLILYFIFK